MMRRLTLTLVALALLVEGALAEAGPAEPAPWREQYAYALGVAAYPYVFPYLFMSQLRWMWTTQPRDPANTPYMPVNHFWHATHLANAKYRDGGTLNNDTLYSTAWVHVGEEPIILSHPEMGERYFTFELAAFDSDNFGYVGQRATGSAAGHFAIVHEGFKGVLPPGVQRLPPAPTPWVLIAGRTLVDGAEDLPNVLALQQRYRLTPLSHWERPDAELPASRDVWSPYDPKLDPLASWRTINRAMTENPPPIREAALLELLAEIRIGPGQDLDALDADSKRGLMRAARDAHSMMIQARTDLAGGTLVNGWRRGPKNAGRLGDHGQYLIRGTTNFRGIVANDPEEAKYFGALREPSGEPLDAHRASYELTFPTRQEPPADAFWSITMYDATTNLVDNPLGRYSIGDRTPGLERNADGSLTIYLQTASPGKARESNWLPAPDGPFTMSLRVYRPRPSVLDGSWAPPPVKVKEK